MLVSIINTYFNQINIKKSLINKLEQDLAVKWVNTELIYSYLDQVNDVIISKRIDNGIEMVN